MFLLQFDRDISCSLTAIPLRSMNEQKVGFAVRKGLPQKKEINDAILKMMVRLFINRFKTEGQASPSKINRFLANNLLFAFI